MEYYEREHQPVVAAGIAKSLVEGGIYAFKINIDGRLSLIVNAFKGLGGWDIDPTDDWKEINQANPHLWDEFEALSGKEYIEAAESVLNEKELAEAKDIWKEEIEGWYGDDEVAEEAKKKALELGIMEWIYE